MNSDLLVELAQLGLDGDKNKLINYLKNLAARSADERKLTLYKKISELLEDYESSSKYQVCQRDKLSLFAAKTSCGFQSVLRIGLVWFLDYSQTKRYPKISK